MTLRYSEEYEHVYTYILRAKDSNLANIACEQAHAEFVPNAYDVFLARRMPGQGRRAFSVLGVMQYLADSNPEVYLDPSILFGTCLIDSFKAAHIEHHIRVAASLLLRYDTNGSVQDLHEALRLLHKARSKYLPTLPGQLPDDVRGCRAAFFGVLAGAFSRLFHASGNTTYLDNAIGHLFRALTHVPDVFLMTPSQLARSLALALATRFEITGRACDLEDAVTLLGVRPAYLPYTAGVCNNAARTIRNLYVEFYIPGKPAEWPLQHMAHDLLNGTTQTSWVALGRPSFLSFSDSWSEEVVLGNKPASEFMELYEPDIVTKLCSPRFLCSSNTVPETLRAVVLGLRFSETRQANDIDTSLALFRAHLSRLSPDHPSVHAILINMAAAFHRRWSAWKDKEDVEEILQICERIAASPEVNLDDNSNEWFEYLVNLPGSLRGFHDTRSSRLRVTLCNLALDRARYTDEAALLLTNVAAARLEVVHAFSSNSDSAKKAVLISKAIITAERAISTPGIQASYTPTALETLARALMLKFSISSGDISILRASCATFRRAVLHPFCTPRLRYTYAQTWLVMVLRQYYPSADTLAYAHRAYSEIILTIPTLPFLSTNLVSDKGNLQWKAHLLRGSAVRKIERLVSTKNASDKGKRHMLSLLDRSRGMSWASVQSLQAPAAALLPSLSSALVLDAPLFVATEDESDSCAAARRALADEIEGREFAPHFADDDEEIVHGVGTDGGEDLDLTDAAAYGPVVLLVPGDRLLTPSDELIDVDEPVKYSFVGVVTPGQRDVRWRRINVGSVILARWIRVFEKLNDISSARAMRGSDGVMKPADADTVDDDDNEDDEHDPNELDDPEQIGFRGAWLSARRSVTGRYNALLSDIWEKVVAPALEDALGSLKSKPELKERSRLWWCPMGQFASLPLHAAGIYGKEAAAAACVSDYVISSYTPTLSSLIKAREMHSQSSLPTHPKVLLLAQPTTPEQSSLPNTYEEVLAIAQMLPSEMLVQSASPMEQLSSARKDNDGVHINVDLEDALRLLPEASILHLACHGQQNKDNPLQSGFLLENGQLTVAHLMALKHPNPFFAFLSACQSASGDSTLPDEFMHLAGSMICAGFKSVVATMWTMQDIDGLTVSEEVYRGLLGDAKSREATLSLDAVPEALDAAVRKLRQDDAPPGRWATYIHLGA